MHNPVSTKSPICKAHIYYCLKKDYVFVKMTFDSTTYYNFRKGINQMILDYINNNDYSNHLGIEFLELDNNHAIARIPHSEKLANPFGSLHGGVLYSLADIVCGSLACTCGNYTTTVNGNMEYISPGMNSEYYECVATLKHSGSHMIFVNCEIKSDTGRLVASGSFTFYKTEISV